MSDGDLHTQVLREIRDEIRATRTELRDEIRATRIEARDEIQATRTEIKAEIAITNARLEVVGHTLRRGSVHE